MKLSNGTLVATFSDPIAYDFFKKSDRNQAIVSSLRKLSSEPVQLDLQLNEQQIKGTVPEPKLTRVQRIRNLEKHEMVKNAIEVFDAEIVEFHDGNRPQ